MELTDVLKLIKLSDSDMYSNEITNQNLDTIEGMMELNTNANGSSLKLANGMMLCWGRQSFSRATNIPQGTMFSTSYIETLFADSFVGDVEYFPSITGAGSGYFSKGDTFANRGSGWILTPTSVALKTYIVHYFAVGRWK